MNDLNLWFVVVLATFLGVELIRRVPGNLHTPLMSGSNAISGIALVGAIAAIASAAHVSGGARWLALALAGAAVGFGAVNVVGGYLVTDRMLKMFGGARPNAKKTTGGGQA